MSKIWVAGVDPNLTSNGLISPGLGDTVSIELGCLRMGRADLTSL